MVRIRYSILLLLVIVGAAAFLGCSSFPKTFSELKWPRFEEGGISVSYPKEVFESAALYRLPKKVEDRSSPSVFGPRRWVLHFEGIPKGRLESSEPRYFFPSESNIYITPLVDDSVQDFDAAYPGLSASAKDLRKWFNEEGGDQNQGLSRKGMRFPIVPFANAARAIESKVRRVDTPSLQGFRMLTYYVNGITGYGATNAELTYDFQGITKDGGFYVSARIGIRHPKLPESMDDPRSHMGASVEESDAEEKRITGWKDESFYPNLSILDAVIRSLELEPDSLLNQP